MTPYQKAGFNELSLFVATGGDPSIEDGAICWLQEDDNSELPFFATITIGHHCMDIFRELQELPKDADGFYLLDGGECPVPGDWVVEFKLRQDDRAHEDTADKLRWGHYPEGTGKSFGDIIAFKPISRPDMPRHSEDAEQPESPAVVEDSGDICGDTVSALDVQEGGDHYKKLKIQPMEYSMANKLDACQHTIIKYVTRFRDKGRIEDLRKAKHCIDMLIEFEQQESKQ